MREVIKDWLEKLESGKYKQCEGQLCDKEKNAYCCLGIAYRALGAKLTKAGDFKFRKDEATFSLGSAAQDALHIPSAEGVFDWDDLKKKKPKLCEKLLTDYGVLPTYGIVLHDGVAATKTCSLVRLNDKDVPFKLIARVIRARPRGLFK